ncbi:hypothetical protein FHT76_005368 [Rhizobium sp. BK176]|nr:hypothetical protein [Rhizobium sp. BK661]MCS4093674.1 hypothetical protein [Rhizobium sp. BK176]
MLVETEMTSCRESVLHGLGGCKVMLANRIIRALQAGLMYDIVPT